MLVLIAQLAACGAPRTLPVVPEPPAAGDWVSYGGDPGGVRFSALREITRDNVGRLEVAWSYRTGELGRSPHETRFEATPLMVEGTLYLSTPLGRVIALDPATGAERWSYTPDPPVNPRLRFGDFASRGVSLWVDAGAAPNAPCERRLIAATIDARLLALDARTGRPCTGFGASSTVDLRQGLRNPPADTTEYEVTSPPAIVNDLIVVGSAIADNNRADAASGEVRAFDVRTGELRWTWDPVPQDPRDPAHPTWSGSVAHRSGGANTWSVIVADPERDLVFLPTSAPSPDYYGGTRLGENRYANSVVALRASTGEVVWHFQTVHHDLWDYDNAAPPALVTIRREGREIPAVLQATKTGMLFVLHRETGEPLFPVEERPVPRSTVPGEEAWPTQPFTAAIPPLSPHRLAAEEVWGPTPADREACRAMLAPLRNEGIFTPPSLEGTLAIPSNVGGAHWGGVAVDTARQLAVIPVNRFASMVQLIPAEEYDPAAARQESQRLGYEYTRMRGTPYVMRRRLLLGPSGLPCSPSPFGALVAVDLRTGAKRWEVPLGMMAPAGTDADTAALRTLGSPNLGGPIVTAGGLVFIAATLDPVLRAFDIETGQELWRGVLPAGGRATPMTYRVGDRQYVVVAAGGGGPFGEGDSLVAFALAATTPAAAALPPSDTARRSAPLQEGRERALRKRIRGE